MEKNQSKISKEQKKEFEEFFGELSNAFSNYMNFYEKEKQVIEQLLEDSYNHVGKIVNCHLIIENLITTELMISKKGGNTKFRIDKASYSEKLQMLPKKGYIYCIFLPGVEQLNKIRNHLVHNLKAQITDKEMDKIDKYISEYIQTDIKTMTVEQRIEEFTLMCIKIFSLRAPLALNQWKPLTSKYPKLKQSIDEMSKDIGA